MSAVIQTCDYNRGDTVVGLVPIQIEGYAIECPPGYLYTVAEVNDGSLRIFRDEVAGKPHYTVVPFDAVEKAYTVYNGISYHKHTTIAVVKVLEAARQNHTRVHLHYGFTETHEQVKTDPSVLGRDWLEENDVEGFIGNSTGPTKIPLLIHNRNSNGGGGLLDDSIVKITSTCGSRIVFYEHPNYHYADVEVRIISEGTGYTDSQGKFVDLFKMGYKESVFIGGVNHANFKTNAACILFLTKMNIRNYRVV